jgi:hypothetical protein
MFSSFISTVHDFDLKISRFSHVFDAVRSISNSRSQLDELQGYITYRATVKTGGPLFDGTRRGFCVSYGDCHASTPECVFWTKNVLNATQLQGGHVKGSVGAHLRVLRTSSRSLEEIAPLSARVVVTRCRCKCIGGPLECSFGNLNASGSVEIVYRAPDPQIDCCTTAGLAYAGGVWVVPKPKAGAQGENLHWLLSNDGDTSRLCNQRRGATTPAPWKCNLVLMR